MRPASLHRSAMQVQLKILTVELKNNYIPEYQTIYDEFVELSWIRLKIEETLQRPNPLHSNQAAAPAMYSFLGSKLARFYRWADEITAANIAPAGDARLAKIRRALQAEPLDRAKKAARLVRSRSQLSRRRPIRFSVTHQSPSGGHSVKPKGSRARRKSTGFSTKRRSLARRPPVNSRLPGSYVGASGGGVGRLVTSSPEIASSSIAVASQAKSLPLRYWSHRLHTGSEGQAIIVHYCTSLTKAEEIARYFVSSSIIGLDIEWKARATARDSIGKNVSVIQLANQERIGVFHIALFRPAK